jgi:hypothetical protein
MENQFVFKGKVSENAQPFASDSFYIPSFLDQHYGSGYADALFAAVSDQQFIKRDSPEMKYRGNTLNREKFFLVDSIENMPVYYYTGFQWLSTEHYKQVDTCPAIHAMVEDFKESSLGCHFNHVIRLMVKRISSVMTNL